MLYKKGGRLIMPSQKRITRSAIIGTAVSILRKEGYDGVNARKIAKELGCSTQPIYSEFGNMNELKAELKKEAEASYVEKVKIFKDNSKFSPYIAYGLGFLHFSKEEKQLFRYLYMCDRHGGGGQTIDDVNAPDIIRVLSDGYGIPKDTALRFHYDMAIYSYGLAVMLNTGYMDMNEEQIIERLQTEFNGLCGAYGFKNLSKNAQ